MYDKRKFTRITVDLTKEEYRRLKQKTQERGCFISFYVRELLSVAMLDGEKAILRRTSP